MTKKKINLEYSLNAIAILEDMAKYGTDPELYKRISDRYYELLLYERAFGTNQATEFLKKSMLFYSKAKGKDRSPETLEGYIRICDMLVLYTAILSYDHDDRFARMGLELREELHDKKPSREITLKLCMKCMTVTHGGGDCNRCQFLLLSGKKTVSPDIGVKL